MVKKKQMEWDFDFLIVGSGFGGSVSALRLSEKSYSVGVIEQGKRFRDEEYAKTNWNLRRYLWLPLLKCFGIQKLSLFKNVLVLSGAGVGGGSLVYANTLLEPGDEFYRAPIWAGLADWKKELAPHYETAKKMLGVTENPHFTFVDEALKECAKALGKESTFGPTRVGVYFGEPGKTVPDPYFGGEGPERAGCIFCGGCMVGCRYNAKNTLNKNYLYLAEKRGARILAETRVCGLRPLYSEGNKIGVGEQDPQAPIGYELEVEDSTAWFFKNRRRLRARRVILAGGVLGTLPLLLRCKHDSKTLPRLSDRLGFPVRTNSEALIGVSLRHPTPERNCSEGIAITSIFHADDHTHIEPVRYPKGSDFMRLLAAPMVDAGGRVTRPLKMVWSFFAHFKEHLRLCISLRWAERTVIFLVMQTLDNQMRFKLGRSVFTVFRRSLVSELDPGTKPAPAYIPIANRVARLYAKILDAIPQSTINEVALNIPTTAHILGGASIGRSPEEGVIDLNHEVFGYPGLFICDGAVIPANLGVNPSLTITAMTERAMSRIPAREG